MAARIYVDAVEGNDIWLAWRVTLPNGVNLTRAHLLGNSGEGTPMTVSLIHESSLGNSKEVIQIYSGVVPSSANEGANGAFNVHSELTDTYWGGLDDIGYTVEARIRATPLEVATGYILEGGNTYAVEVNLSTTDYGTITVAAEIQMDYLHSV